MRREQRADREVHVSTGKQAPAGEEHEPQWSEWFRDDGYDMRQCRYPECDLDDYRKTQISGGRP